MAKRKLGEDQSCSARLTEVLDFKKKRLPWQDQARESTSANSNSVRVGLARREAPHEALPSSACHGSFVSCQWSVVSCQLAAKL
jgi:hypothetical protein